MKYEEAVSIVSKNPGESFTGIILTKKDTFLAVYVISSDEEDPDWVTVSYEAGYLFSYSGEEDCFSLDEIPEDVLAELKKIDFKSSINLPNILGLTSDYVLYKLFPNLPNPDNADKSKFISAAKVCVNKWNEM